MAAPAESTIPPTVFATAQPAESSIYIQEYRVTGARLISERIVGETVYPFLGPGRTASDVEQARQALEKIYHEKGFQTVSVEVPAQRPKHGVVVLKVVENAVGTVRVKGSRYYLPSTIRRQLPSLTPGSVPNFEQVTREIVDVNQLADRRITPALEPGRDPGTVDVVLNVKDSLPLHGSVELNNRRSPDTVPLRLNATVNYDNLWQLGHTIGASFQIAPERPSDATVYSGYYLARFASSPWSLMLQGTVQDSDVSTLGGAAVAGRGEIFGLRAMRGLPGSGEGFYHSISLGFDYKHFDEDVVVGDEAFSTPILYWPFSVAYGASLLGTNRFTEFNAALNWNIRGMGSDAYEFDAKRYNQSGSWLYLRGDLTHTQDLPLGLQAFAKIQGQISSDPLINSEQFAGGGLSTVRGYLESTALGDNGIFGTFELRSPSFFSSIKKPDEIEPANEWRVYGFLDGGRLTLRDPLPDQDSQYSLASWGVGSFVRLFGHLNGSIDAAWPLDDVGTTSADDVYVSFRVWSKF